VTRTDLRTGLEVLSEDECWELLASISVGRLAAIVNGSPEIFPVNFVVDGRRLVFRSEPGTKLAAVGGEAVAFEADRTTDAFRTGWSVIVKGDFVELTDPLEIGRAATLGLRAWSTSSKPHWLRIEAREITGRRIHKRDDISD
jgi:uncharacterized protein